MAGIIFYLVRHGEAETNFHGIIGSMPELREFHLTEKGRKQIAAVAESLASKKIDAIASSPIMRTRETAEIISGKTGVPIVFDERLRETDFGVFNGHSIGELFEKYPDPKMRMQPDPEDGIESFIDVRGRLKHFLDEVKEKYAGKKVVIVSHGDPLEQLHGILTNESPGASSGGWYPAKGSCTEMAWKQ